MRSGTRWQQVQVAFVAWLPLAGVLIGYAIAQWINAPLSAGATDGAVNAFGFALHVDEPVVADGWIFGRVPGAGLQQTWFRPGQAHWYDAVAALVYVSHFVAIPLTAVLFWLRRRERFRPWLLCVLWMSVIGIAGYVVYPMSPPWMAAQWGIGPPMTRISGIGWDYLHLEWVGDLLGSSQSASNPVAAMPSLHAAAPLLLTGFLWPTAAWWVRSMLVCYTGAMALTLVYTGEHYVIDVLAGWLTALAALGISAVWARRSQDRAEPARRGAIPVAPGAGSGP